MTGDKTAAPPDLQTTDPTVAVSPPSDPAPRPASSGWTLLLWILGGLLLVALPFGAVGILAVAVSGMFLGKEVMEAPGIPLMLGLFMVAGGTSVGARVWPALRWGGGAAAVGTLALIAFAVITGDRVDAYKDDGVKLTDGLALVWLIVIAIAAWGLRGRERWLGPLLAAVMLTSRLNVYPAFAILAAFSKADDAIILVPIVATGIAAGALGVLLLGAIVAWLARALQRWVAPATVIGVLAVAALVVRILV